MPKRYHDKNVYEACKDRISYVFDNFEKIYVSYSGGKDSTVMLYMVLEEAIRRNRKIGVFIVDLEGQYKLTIKHMEETIDKYIDYIDIYWFCLPISLRNAVSVYEPKWCAWDKKEMSDWIREVPKYGITDEKLIPGFEPGMEFEDFILLFGEWYAEGNKTACFVGIRTEESLNRYRTISNEKKVLYEDNYWSTLVTPNVYNFYPIYDWRTRDIWIYHCKNKDKPYNQLYEYMYKAGLNLKQMRICQPYGDDQRRGLWLFHLIEPETWGKVVSRVNGANSGALYINESGNITGYNKIKKPNNHTWKSFAMMLLNSMPDRSKKHYTNKIVLFEKWWVERGYPEGIPDEADYNLEMKKGVPSWRRVCKSLLRNDYWCKGLGFTQHKNHAYKKYLDLMERRKTHWREEGLTNKVVSLSLKQNERS